MMWIAQATRAQFLDVIQAERSLAQPRDLQTELRDDIPARVDDLLLVWRVDPSVALTLPSVVVVLDGTTRDFLAWTSTYLTDYRPFTAQIRVLEQAQASRYFRLHPAPPLGRIQNACAALIVAETFAYLDGDRDPTSLPGQTFTNCFSFSQARDLTLWGPPGPDDHLFDNWRYVRNLVRQPRLALDPIRVQLPWKAVFRIIGDGQSASADEDNELIFKAAERLFTAGELGGELWQQLVRRLGIRDDAALNRRASREQRVLALEAMARQRPRTGASTELYAFLCGHLANAIAPGSFEHWGIVQRLFPDLRPVLLWYGLCVGVTPDSNARNAFSGLGRRLLRDVLDEGSVLDRPRADIAISELGAAYSHQVGHPGFFTFNSGYAQVEIEPCITTLIKWPQPEAAFQKQEQLFSGPTTRGEPAAELALVEVRDTLNRLTSAHKRLMRSLGVETQQRRTIRRDPKE